MTDKNRREEYYIEYDHVDEWTHNFRKTSRRAEWLSREQMIEVLTKHGADVNVKDRFGRSPLYTSILNDDKDILEILISHGADVNAKNVIGHTPLRLSAWEGRREIVNILISNGADVNVKNITGNTPLHESALQGRKDIVELLIRHGADVNVKGSSGQTPLIKCARRSKKEIANILISHGADVNAKDNNKKAPLHFVARNNHKELVQLLIKHGADIDPVDWLGDTPLMLAEENGHKDIVQILRDAKPVQAGDSIFRRVKAAFFGHSSSTRKVSVQSSDGNGQITKVKREEKEVSRQVKEICEKWTETLRKSNIDDVKGNRCKDTQGQSVQDLRTETDKTSSLLASEVDYCTSAGSSFKPIISKTTSTPAAAVTTSSASSVASTLTSPPTTPTPEPRDEVTYLAQKLIKAVKSKRKSGEDDGEACQRPNQDTFKALSSQLNGNIIVIKNKKINNNYHNTYYNDKQVTCEEVKAEASEKLDVVVEPTSYSSLLHSPEGDDDDNKDECNMYMAREEGETRGEKQDGRNLHDGIVGKSYAAIRGKEAAESSCKVSMENTTNVSIDTTNAVAFSTDLMTTTSTASSSPNAESKTSSPATTLTSSSSSTTTTTRLSAAEIKRRIESQAGYMEKMIQCCVADGGVCQGQKSDLATLQHGSGDVKVNLNFIVQPKNVTVYNNRLLNCEKAEVENAEMMPVNSKCNFNYAPRPSSEDEDNDDTSSDDDAEDREVYVEDNNNISN